MAKAVIFDLYGTLIDIQTDEHDISLYSNLAQYLSYHMVRISPDGLKRAYAEEVSLHMARSAEAYPEVDVYKVFHEIMHKFGPRRYPKNIVKDTSMLFRALSRKRFKAFDGIYDVLTSLAGEFKLGLVSDAQWVFTEPEMDMLNLNRFFDVRVLSSVYGFKKPDVRLFQTALKKLKTKPEEAIYIGDNPQKDLVGAKKAGLKCVLFRAYDVSFNGLKPDKYFSNYSELQEVLKEILV